MAAVTLAVQMENEYLGFDFVDEMIQEANVGDVVTLTYDFGAGLQKIVGTYEGRETRESGETFLWVREQDKGKTRYAIPTGMVEGLRVEARAENLPVALRPATHQPQDNGPVEGPTTKQGTLPAYIAKRQNLTESHHLRSREGRTCARLDYEGMML